MTARLFARAVTSGGWWTVVLAVTTLAGAVAELLLPMALGRAVDAVVGDRSWVPGVVALGLILVIIQTDAGGLLAGGAATARATERLRRLLMRHLFALAPATARRYPAGDLVGRVVGQVGDAGQAGPAVVLGVVAALPPVGSLVALALLDPTLGATFLIGLILMTLLLRAFVADATDAQAGYQAAQGVLVGRLTETLGGARTIAAAGTVEAEIGRVLTPVGDLRRHGERTWTVLARAAGRTAAIAPLLQLSVILAGGLALAAGRLTPGGLLAALQYAALGAGVGGVLAALNRIVRTRAAGRRAAEVLAEPVAAYGCADLPPGRGELRLRGVTVRAGDGRALLDRVDLDLPAGAVVAVVGASGAGKSVLAAVAGGLRRPDEGEVHLDGTALETLSRSALRTATGYGFERPVLVGESIGDAVGLGDDPVPLARAAAVHEVISRLPDGYASRLDRTPLSGGEVQRLGLARALRAQRLLVLDDATSNVDTATEHLVSRTLMARSDRRTRLVVTHRVATAARADLVAWLDGGRLRGLAPHSELWGDPAYRAVFQP
jgi:ATP-binding cassette, subfamily B, bacterial